MLGAILLDPHVYQEHVSGVVAPDDLTRESHRTVLRSIERLASRGEYIGFQSLQAELGQHGELEGISGSQFLVGLMSNVPTLAHASSYVGIVARTAMLRRLIRVATEVVRLGLTTDDAYEAVKDAQELLFAISETAIHRQTVGLKTALLDFFKLLEERQDGEPVGITTGIESLDRLTGGFQQSDLIILAGRPGLGKTSLALNFVENAALKFRKTCAVFSLEMTEMQLVQRLISMNTEIDGNRLRRGRLTQPEFTSISAASSRLQAAPVYLDGPSRLTTTDILARARRLQAEHGLDLLVIDYLQLIEGGDTRNRVQEVAEITRSLKAIARELDVPVIALSQLSRQIESRGTEPMLSDLRDSGSIEQDADLVMFLWQKDKEDREQGLVRLKVAKHRNGPTGELALSFQSEYTRFRESSSTLT